MGSGTDLSKLFIEVLGKRDVRTDSEKDDENVREMAEPGSDEDKDPEIRSRVATFMTTSRTNGDSRNSRASRICRNGKIGNDGKATKCGSGWFQVWVFIR